MHVSTSRFGTIEVEDDRVINFESPLLGLSEYRRFALLQPSDESAFYWLQSVDSPELAFVVTDPTLFVTGYEVPIRQDQLETLSLESLDDAQVLVIVNKYGECLTGNLQGPIVVNTLSGAAEQLVLADQRWSTRHKLVDIPDAKKAASA